MLYHSSMSVTLLECAVTKNVPVSPLECAVTKLLDLKSFRIRSYKKSGGGGGYQCGGQRKLLRRGYDAIPGEDLHSDRVAGIISVCLG